MRIIESTKEVVDLVKKYNDIELYKKIVDLQGQITELAGRNFEVEAELREAKEKLALRTSLVFKEPYYWKDGDRTPYCQHCFEKSGIAFHLDPVLTEPLTGSKGRWCRSCCSTVYELLANGEPVALDPVQESWMSD